MRFARTVIVCYITGIACLVIGVYYATWNTTQALWENPELAHSGIPVEQWIPELRDKHKNIVYPYREIGLSVLAVGMFFILTPTIASQVATEIKAEPK